MMIFNLFTPNDDPRPVFLTGNFNAWTTRDEHFKMTKLREGHYQYTFDQLPQDHAPLEYKYVKGGWEAEELGMDGHPRTNRRMEVARGKVTDVVPRWKQHSAGYDPSFYPDIRVVAKEFSLPQLRRRRRIAVLLPWNYEQSGRAYPVLYLQDGQNLFEDSAPFGTWGVDKRLAALAEQGLGDFIVVAIDHGGKDRIREFSPYQTKWGDGLGRAYATFLAETLKPYIDKHFRTLPQRAHTGIGGSSMGGLISIYAGMMFPQVYSKFLIFSPSLWLTPHLHFEPIRFADYPEATKVYLYGGGKESSTLLTELQTFKSAAEAQDKEPRTMEFRLEIDPEGRHNEPRWGQEFPKAAQWLFG